MFRQFFKKRPARTERVRPCRAARGQPYQARPRRLQLADLSGPSLGFPAPRRCFPGRQGVPAGQDRPFGGLAGQGNGTCRPVTGGTRPCRQPWRIAGSAQLLATRRLTGCATEAFKPRLASGSSLEKTAGFVPHFTRLEIWPICSPAWVLRGPAPTIRPHSQDGTLSEHDTLKPVCCRAAPRLAQIGGRTGAGARPGAFRRGGQ